MPFFAKIRRFTNDFDDTYIDIFLQKDPSAPHFITPKWNITSLCRQFMLTINIKIHYPAG